jgi:hypothetical protein
MLSFMLTMCLYGVDVAPMFPVNLKGSIHSSPIVADIDGDNMNEILVGSDSDTLYCLDHDGYIEWKFGTGDDIISSPTLGDIDQDGYLDVVFQSEDGYLFVLDNQGNPLTGWPQQLEDIPYNARYNSTPALADIDGDLELEIVTLSPKYCPGQFSYTTTRVYAFNADGSTLWTWDRDWPGAGSWNAVTSPTIADVDRDGILDVVVYFGITYHSPNGPGVGMYALRGTDGHNFYERETDIASTRSSPTIADINHDGKMDAIVTCFPPPYTCLQAITIEDDHILWSHIANPFIDNYSLSSPCIGNINEDPYPEIIPGGSLAALDKDGNIIWYNYDIYSYNSSTVLGDIDGDGSMEIFTALSSTGEVYGFDGNGDILTGFPLETDTVPIQSTPVLCDLDRDGYLDIIVGSTNGKLYEWDTDYEYYELGMAWPGFKNDIRRNNHYRPVIDIDLYPQSIPTHAGDTIDLTISVTNNMNLSHSVRISLDACLPSGRIIPILENFPHNAFPVNGYTTVNGNISVAIPEGIPQMDVWLRGTVAGVSGYTTDKDSSLIQILGEHNVLNHRKCVTYNPYVVTLPEFTSNIDGQTLHNTQSHNQERKNSNVLSIYPNPFTMKTKIRFPLEHQGNMSVGIYNVLGQEIIILENFVKVPGYYTATWDGKDTKGQTVSPGIYFLTFKSRECKETKKLLFMK